jgi:hypothetical protein
VDFRELYDQARPAAASLLCAAALGGAALSKDDAYAAAVQPPFISQPEASGDFPIASGECVENIARTVHDAVKIGINKRERSVSIAISQTVQRLDLMNTSTGENGMAVGSGNGSLTVTAANSEDMANEPLAQSASLLLADSETIPKACQGQSATRNYVVTTSSSGRQKFFRGRITDLENARAQSTETWKISMKDICSKMGGVVLRVKQKGIYTAGPTTITASRYLRVPKKIDC